MRSHPRPGDLTRWNRAGLECFRYIDGNAITHLEHLRERLAKAFPEPLWPTLREREVPEEEPHVERQQRITEQYNGERRDWAWEIARSFARAAHVLTEHVDAFANEGFLGTATQWEYLRRLVAMIDYRPAPPASASTTLAFSAKDAAPGLVEAGFQVKHTPDDGSPPVIFETLAEVEIDPALNDLRLQGWDRNPCSFRPYAPLRGDGSDPWILPEDAEVSVGELGVLTAGDAAAAVEVANVSAAKDAVAVTNGATEEWVLGDTELHLAPADVIAPRLNGVDVARFAAAHGLAAGAVVGWRRNGTLGFARAVATDATGLKLADVTPSGPAIGAAGTEFFVAKELSHEQYLASRDESTDGEVTEGEWRLPLETIMPTSMAFRLVAISRRGQIGSEFFTREDLLDEPTEDPDVEASFRVLSVDDRQPYALGFFDADLDTPIGTSVEGLSLETHDFDGAPSGLASGDHLVAEDEGRARAAVQIEKIEERDDSFRLTFTSAPADLTSVARLHGPFGLRLRPRHHDRNPERVEPGNLILDLDGEAIPEALRSGRTVVVEPDDPDAGGAAFKASITAVVDAADGTTPTLTKDPRRVRFVRGRRIKRMPGARMIVRQAAGGIRIELDAPVSAFDDYRIGSMVIRANAVATGHGETKPGIALGSGEAALPSQSFVLAKDDVSFVADSSLEAGVRAALDVVIGGRRYEEVSSFADSEPADPHYTVRRTEDGDLRLTFGDGYRGRRLPTGRNNVRASCRVGVGSAGNNLPPGSLEKTVRPHPLVASVRQALIPSGGQAAEPAESVRRVAPAHLRALGRAVSLADYQHLAASQPGVWSAKAYQSSRGAGRVELIRLTVVPADGGPLGELEAQLEQRFTELGLPGHVVRIERFDEVPLPLAATIRVDSAAFDPTAVEAEVRAALYAELKLEVRLPGQPLYRSEVFQVIEAIEGAANSDIELFAGQAEPLRSVSAAPLRPSSRSERGDVWAVWPTNRQVVFVPSPNDLLLTMREATL